MTTHWIKKKNTDSLADGRLSRALDCIGQLAYQKVWCVCPWNYVFGTMNVITIIQRLDMHDQHQNQGRICKTKTNYARLNEKLWLPLGTNCYKNTLIFIKFCCHWQTGKTFFGSKLPVALNSNCYIIMDPPHCA